MNLLLSSSGGSHIPWYIPVNKGFDLLMTAWELLRSTKFQLQGAEFLGEISLAQIMIGGLFMYLAGSLIYYFFLGD